MSEAGDPCHLPLRASHRGHPVSRKAGACRRICLLFLLGDQSDFLDLYSLVSPPWPLYFIHKQRQQGPVSWFLAQENLHSAYKTGPSTNTSSLLLETQRLRTKHSRQGLPRGPRAQRGYQPPSTQHRELWGGDV